MVTFGRKREIVKKIKLYNLIIGLIILPAMFIHELSHYIPTYLFFKELKPRIVFKLYSLKSKAYVRFEDRNITVNGASDIIKMAFISISPLFTLMFFVYLVILAYPFSINVFLLAYVISISICLIPSKADIVIFSKCVYTLFKRD